MTEQKVKSTRRGVTRTEIIVAVIAILVGSLLLEFWPGIILLILLIGWIFYPFQMAGEITIEWVSVVIAGVALLLFTWGVHWFCRWIAAQKSEASEWRVTRSVQLVTLILFAFVAGTSMIGIVHQVTWLATTKEKFLTDGGGSRRSASKNNLKQIGLAFHNYHDTHQHFAASTFTARGNAYHSWQTYLLPFIDQAPLYENIDTNISWKSPKNRPQIATRIDVFLNPGVDWKKEEIADNLPAVSHYAGNIRVLVPSQKPAFRDITDGTSNTILSGEVGTHFKAWGDPTNLRDPALGINKHPNGFGGPFKGGSQFVLADGAVRFISEDIDPAVLKALATPAGGEEITYDAY